MKAYKFKAREKSGKLKEGVIRAESPTAAAQHFKENGMLLITLKEEQAAPALFTNLSIMQSVSFVELMMFTRQMYALCLAGLPLVSCIKSLEATTKNKLFRSILEEVRRDIEAGSSFSLALSKHPKVFNKIFVSTIKAGEASGALPEVLKRLSGALEKEQETKSRIKQALGYPIIVITVIILAMLTLGVFVLPRFATLFSSFGKDLPLFTRILISGNTIFQTYWYMILIAAALLIALFKWMVRNPAGKLFWDRFLLHIYIFGPLYVKIYMSSFARTIATLIKSGVPIVEALDLAGKTADNVVLAKAMETIKDKVREGKGIAVAMKDEPIFPAMVVQLVASGEESGRIDELMEMVADFYEREADYTIKNMTLLLEPMLLMFIAGVVLVLALGIFLPLWNLSSVFN